MSKRTKEKISSLAISASQKLPLPLANSTRVLTKQHIELARVKHHTYAKLIDLGFGWLRTLVRAGAWCFVGWCLYRAIYSLAGQNTHLNAVVSAAVKFGADKWAAYIVATLCGVGYVHERRLRQSSNREQGTYIRSLESKLDPGRTTSQLTSTGRPSKEDSDAI